VSVPSLKILADLDPAVESVVGYTRYRIEGDPSAAPLRRRRSRSSTAEALARRPERGRRNNHLVGTKRRVASEREVLVVRGRSDGRTVILVPEVKGGTCTGITLLHVRFHDRLPAPVMRTVLQGYDRRYDRLVDWVSETEGAFRDDLLADLAVVELLSQPDLSTSPTTGAA
jgi:glucosamine--fructose-6-phosphate aminotransferase (isomerizing)